MDARVRSSNIYSMKKVEPSKRKREKNYDANEHGHVDRERERIVMAKCILVQFQPSTIGQTAKE